jgi:hypothetical protein
LKSAAPPVQPNHQEGEHTELVVQPEFTDVQVRVLELR